MKRLLRARAKQSLGIGEYGCIIPAREGSRSQGTRTQGETFHETCGQGITPDGRFGMHVCGGSRSDDRITGRGADPSVQSEKVQLPDVRGK